MFFIALFYFHLFASSNNFDTFMWVQIESMTSKETISNVIKFASENGYNNLLVQVRSRDNAAYNSKLVPKYSTINSQFDPLEYIIEAGHKHNLNIHAWLNMYVSWSGKYNPPNNDHLINVNYAWRDRAFTSVNPTYTNHYISPLHPDVNLYLLNIINEVCNNYNIDGIHLDYIRFKDGNYGNNKSGIKQFTDKFMVKKSLLSINDFTHNHKENWNKYKRDKVTELVQKTYRLLYSKFENIKLSVAVKPNLLEAKERFSQDWVFWLKTGNYVALRGFFLIIRNTPDPRLQDQEDPTSNRSYLCFEHHWLLSSENYILRSLNCVLSNVDSFVL